MRLCTLLAFLASTAIACGGNDIAPEEVTPEAAETAGGPYNTPDDPLVLFDMTKEAIVGVSATVPPESGIEHEGIVWLQARTVDNVVDSAWVIVSSGRSEVDEFALDHFLRNSRTTFKIGWGDPPFKIQFVVRVPDEHDVQEESSTDFDTAEVGAFPFLAAILPGSDLQREGDVLVALHMVEGLVDTAWVVESSGFSEVDEFAMNHVLTGDDIRHPFYMDMENDSVKARIFVRHQPKN